VSIHALLAAGVVDGLEVEDVAAAVRLHASLLEVTEDGRCGARAMPRVVAHGHSLACVGACGCARTWVQGPAWPTRTTTAHW
jgi:hypothetical protein